MSFYFYQPYLITHWLLPLGSGVFGWLIYRLLLSKMDQKYSALSKSHQVDFSAVIPNYTASFFRFGLIYVGAITALVLALVFTQLPKALRYASAQARTSIEALSPFPSNSVVIEGPPSSVSLEPDLSGPAILAAIGFGWHTYKIIGLGDDVALTVPETWNAEKVHDELTNQAWIALPDSKKQKSPYVRDQSIGTRVKVLDDARDKIADPIWQETTSPQRAFIARDSVTFATELLSDPERSLLRVSFLFCFLLFGYAIAQLFLLAMGFAVLGYWLENRLIKQYPPGGSRARGPSAKDLVKVVSPFWAFGYRLFGKSARYWLYRLQTQGGQTHKAFITPDALALSSSGELLDLSPRWGSAHFRYYLWAMLAIPVPPLLAIWVLTVYFYSIARRVFVPTQVALRSSTVKNG